MLLAGQILGLQESKVTTSCLHDLSLFTIVILKPDGKSDGVINKTRAAGPNIWRMHSQERHRLGKKMARIHGEQYWSAENYSRRNLSH